MESVNQNEKASTDQDPALPADDDNVESSETRSKGENGALWLLAGVVAMAGTTLWMIRDVWTSKPVAANVQTIESSGTAQAKPSPQGKPSTAKVKPVTDVAEDMGPVQREIEMRRQQDAKRLAALKAEAERIEAERRAAEQELKEGRAAQAELEEQRRLAAQKLEEERAAHAALEKARREAEQRLAKEQAERQALERQRRAAERKLAQEKAARQDLERKARLEQEKALEAKLAAEQAALDRAQAEAELKAKAESKPRSGGTDISKMIVNIAPDTSTDSAANDVAAADQPAGSKSFSSNPCEGPQAKFLSTCR